MATSTARSVSVRRLERSRSRAYAVQHASGGGSRSPADQGAALPFDSHDKEICDDAISRAAVTAEVTGTVSTGASRVMSGLSATALCSSVGTVTVQLLDEARVVGQSPSAGSTLLAWSGSSSKHNILPSLHTSMQAEAMLAAL